MGGDCLNVGCVPSKALISAARVANTVRNSEAYGVEVSGYVTVNFGKVRAHDMHACACDRDTWKGSFVPSAILLV